MKHFSVFFKPQILDKQGLVGQKVTFLILARVRFQAPLSIQPPSKQRPEALLCCGINCTISNQHHCRRERRRKTDLGQWLFSIWKQRWPSEQQKLPSAKKPKIDILLLIPFKTYSLLVCIAPKENYQIDFFLKYNCTQIEYICYLWGILGFSRAPNKNTFI